MDNKQINKLFIWMQEFAIMAGDIALFYRGKVENKEKQAYDLAGVKQSEQGRARTDADEIIQELFLAELYKRWPDTCINVEENTNLISLFKTGKRALKKSFLTVHLDPIDGTLNYVTGKKEFAVGLAISDAAHTFTHTVIYAPMFKKLFFASPRGSFIKMGKKITAAIQKKNPSMLIYEKRLLSPQGRHALGLLGFSFAPPGSSHHAIINTSLGNANAFLYGGSNPHDGMIPCAFARGLNVLPYTAQGKPIAGRDLTFTRTNQFFSFNRIPSLCYYSCGKEMRRTMQTILSQKENLHEEYLSRFMNQKR